MTSTRGRFNSDNGVMAKPVTRPEVSSHNGRAPIKASACATSSPPVRMLEVPQADSAIERGHSPASCQ